MRHETYNKRQEEIGVRHDTRQDTERKLYETKDISYKTNRVR